MSIAPPPPFPLDAVEEAITTADAAARRAGVRIRRIDDLDGVLAAERLLDDLWGNGGPVSANLLRGAISARSYLCGAYLEDALVGMCLALWGPPSAPVLYSHIAAVSTAARGRDVGYAIKLHQRATALETGVNTIAWTFDPLVARNAHFNLHKLGARPADYHVDHYGRMRDEINGDDETDRLLIEWRLDSETTRHALGVTEAPHRDDTEEPVFPLLLRGDDLQPVLGDGAGQRVLVSIPSDIEHLRRTDPATAHLWRRAVRDTLGSLLAAGAVVEDFDRSVSGYIIRKAPSA